MSTSIAKPQNVVFAVVIAFLLCLAVPSAAHAAEGKAASQAGKSAAQELTTQATVTKKAKLFVDSATQNAKTLKAKGLKAKKATWKSSNANVVAVKAGKATAKKAGKATVTAKQGAKTFAFNITVKKVSINKKAATLDVGGTVALKLTGDKIASAKSSDPTVASVTSAGKVTAAAAGGATITLTSQKGLNYTCAVTVKGEEPDTDDPTVTGAEINDVVLDTEFFEDKYGDEVAYVMHLKIKDGYEGYDKWGSYFKPIVGKGATYTVKPEEGYTYGGYTVSVATLTVTAGNNTREYYVEAYPASSVFTFGVFEGNSMKS